MNIKLIAVLLLSAGGVLAEDITLRNGTEYKDVKVLRYDAAGIEVMTTNGVSRIPLRDLPADQQQRFGYSAEKEESFHAKAASEKSKRALQEAREKWEKENVSGISGKITDIAQGSGIILDGKRFVKCDTTGLINDQYYACRAYWDGTYTYVTVLGASRTIPRYVWYAEQPEMPTGEVKVKPSGPKMETIGYVGSIKKEKDFKK